MCHSRSMVGLATFYFHKEASGMDRDGETNKGLLGGVCVLCPRMSLTIGVAWGQEPRVGTVRLP